MKVASYALCNTASEVFPTLVQFGEKVNSYYKISSEIYINLLKNPLSPEKISFNL